MFHCLKPLSYNLEHLTLKRTITLSLVYVIFHDNNASSIEMFYKFHLNVDMLGIGLPEYQSFKFFVKVVKRHLKKMLKKKLMKITWTPLSKFSYYYEIVTTTPGKYPLSTLNVNIPALVVKATSFGRGSQCEITLQQSWFMNESRGEPFFLKSHWGVSFGSRFLECSAYRKHAHKKE